MEGVHDLGGLQGFGAVVTDDGELSHHDAWELRAQAIAMMVGGGTVRPWIERLPAATYLSLSYYQRWLLAAENASIERERCGVEALTGWRRTFGSDPDATPPHVENHTLREAMDHWMTHGNRMPPSTAPLFAVGDVVVVHRMRTTEQNRCPRYLRGASGVVEQVCGSDRVPGASPTEQFGNVYTVEFASADLWGTTDEPGFTVLVDLFEHYLSPLDHSA